MNYTDDRDGKSIKLVKQQILGWSLLYSLTPMTVMGGPFHTKVVGTPQKPVVTKASSDSEPEKLLKPVVTSMSSSDSESPVEVAGLSRYYFSYGYALYQYM